VEIEGWIRKNLVFGSVGIVPLWSEGVALVCAFARLGETCVFVVSWVGVLVLKWLFYLLCVDS
jgi:hypothetical protein